MTGVPAADAAEAIRRVLDAIDAGTLDASPAQSTVYMPTDACAVLARQMARVLVYPHADSGMAQFGRA